MMQEQLKQQLQNAQMKKEKLLAGSRKKGQEAANEQDEKRRKLDPTSPKTSAQIQGYTNFVVAVASHFAGKGIIWELYNEPDLSVRKMTAAQYATLVISVGKAIRANPRTRAEILMVSCAPRPSACWSFTCNPLLVPRVSRTRAPPP